MPRYKVAHIKEQGIDLIIIPLDSAFRTKSHEQQNEITLELQKRADAAGLAGTVVPVWDAGGGRMAFIAPQRWHPYFKGIDLAFVVANYNRELFW